MDAANIRLGKILNNIKLKISVFFNRIKSEKNFYYFLPAVFLLIVAGLVFPGGAAHAFWDEAASGIMNYVIYPLVYVIFWILFYIAYTIAWIGASLISANLNPEFMNAVLGSPGILQGWQIFRDVANLLFILILLLVAFGTIFRSSSYNIKKSLPTLIIVAFLINFSMMLTGIVIDFTNILMYGILKMMCAPGDSQCFQNFYSQLMGSVDSLYRTYTLTGGVTWSGVSAQSAVGMAIATVYTFVFGLVLIALAIFLMIRVAAFALLIILSPLAFFGQVAPGLKGISDKWWDNLLQYAFFGPIFALFLYIAGLMSAITLSIGSSAITNNPSLSTFGELFATIIANIIPLIFLLAIIPITKSMGIAGANAVMNNTVGFGTGLATGATKYVGNAFDRYLARGAGMTGSDKEGLRGTLSRKHAWVRNKLSYTSPGAIKRAYKAQLANQEHDYDVARGTIQDRLGWKRTGVESERDNVGEAEAHRQLGEMNIKNTDEMVTKLAKAIESGNGYLTAEIMRALATNGDINDALDRLSERKDHTAADFNQFMNGDIKRLLGETKTAKLAGEIGKLEEKNGTYIYQGHNKYNKEKDSYELLDLNNDDTKRGRTKEDAQAMQIDAMLGRWDTSPERGRMSKVSQHTFVDKNGDATVQGAAIMAQMQGQEAKKKVSSMKPKAAKAIYAAMSGPNKTIFEQKVFIEKAAELDDKGQPKYKNLNTIGGSVMNVEKNKKTAQIIVDEINNKFYKKVETVSEGERRPRRSGRQQTLAETESEAEEEEAVIEDEEQQQG